MKCWMSLSVKNKAKNIFITHLEWARAGHDSRDKSLHSNFFGFFSHQ
jgi:hypothetical protein